MGKIIDLTGQRFGKLVVLNLNKILKRGTYWLCKCDCGNYKIICGCELRNNDTKSCGCLQKQIVTRHGMYKSKIYTVYANMLSRCYNSKNKRYKHYGGRGIKVCDKWLESDGQGFLNFLHDMGEPPNQMSIDRINNNGNYEPANCRWANIKQQNQNYRNNRNFTINSETKCLNAWCEFNNINPQVVRARLKYGWLLERALGLEKRDNKNVRYIEINGKRQSIHAWCKEYNFKYDRAIYLLKNGKSLKEILGL